jgi:uridine kinase
MGHSESEAAPDVTRSLSRLDELVAAVAAAVPAARGEDCVRVGIDGVDGAGKTTFAAKLGRALQERGRPVVRISVDDFHRRRADRYRRGRDSPVGFWLDAFDYARLHADVLVPLGPGGTRRFRTAAHDLACDRVLQPPAQLAEPGSVLLVDGLFLHRDELVRHWDLSVFLDVPFDVSVARVAARDATGADRASTRIRRYVEAQQIYSAACAPRTRASLVIDNS